MLGPWSFNCFYELPSDSSDEENLFFSNPTFTEADLLHSVSERHMRPSQTLEKKLN